MSAFVGLEDSLWLAPSSPFESVLTQIYFYSINLILILYRVLKIRNPSVVTLVGLSPCIVNTLVQKQTRSLVKIFPCNWNTFVDMSVQFLTAWFDKFCRNFVNISRFREVTFELVSRNFTSSQVGSSNDISVACLLAFLISLTPHLYLITNMVRFSHNYGVQ
jgi:hypothetical protein